MTRGGGGAQTRGHNPSLVTVSSRRELANKAALGAAIPDQGALELNWCKNFRQPPHPRWEMASVRVEQAANQSFDILKKKKHSFS